MTRPRLDILLGPCDDMRAEVFVCVTLPAEAGTPRLSGTLVGPHCRLATTLPATARVVDLGPATVDDAGGGRRAVGRAVGRAIVTEPAYWTPDLPAVYRLELDITGTGPPVQVRHAGIGLRRFGVRRRSLWLDGRRWVPRGVTCPAAEFDTATLRGAAATAVLDEPGDDQLAQADGAGVAVIARLGRIDDGAAERIANWAIHPAVMLAVLPATATDAEVAALTAAVRPVKGTLLLGQAAAGAEPPPAMPAGIDCLVVMLDRGRLPHDGWREPPPVPLVAWRNVDLPCGERRRACDALQADLAAWGLAAAAQRPAWDWAGYVVG